MIDQTAPLGPSGKVLEYDLITQTLKDIMESMGLAPTIDNFRDIGLQLSALAHKPPPAWGAKYIHSVYHGYKGAQPSPALSHAIMALAQTVDSTPIGLAGADWVKVLAYPGRIPEGALIPATAQVIRCARPGCPVMFVRTSPAQRFHDYSCARLWAREKRKKIMR